MIRRLADGEPQVAVDRWAMDISAAVSGSNDGAGLEHVESSSGIRMSRDRIAAVVAAGRSSAFLMAQTICRPRAGGRSCGGGRSPLGMGRGGPPRMKRCPAKRSVGAVPARPDHDKACSFLLGNGAETFGGIPCLDPASTPSAASSPNSSTASPGVGAVRRELRDRAGIAWTRISRKLRRSARMSASRRTVGAWTEPFTPQTMLGAGASRRPSNHESCAASIPAPPSCRRPPCSLRQTSAWSCPSPADRPVRREPSSAIRIDQERRTARFVRGDRGPRGHGRRRDAFGKRIENGAGLQGASAFPAMARRSAEGGGRSCRLPRQCDDFQSPHRRRRPGATRGRRRRWRGR